MKELSIEEKAKRYDEAIEALGSLFAEQAIKHCNRVNIKDITNIFPELKESEDEKMMNQLHSWMKEFGGAEEYTEKVYQWIKGLLEKQGEQKPAETRKFKVGDVVKYNGTEYKITAVESNGYRVYALTYDEDAASLISFSAPAILVEHKPWSEEDEDILNTIINHFKVDIGCTDEDDMVRWLKFLKDRVLPQPKQEWSEEDKNMLQSILDEYKSMPTEKRNWLKSLKERYTWRPSDNELEVLRLAAEKDGACLMGLYEQLKKLKD